MKYVEAPKEWRLTPGERNRSIFLAGGITGCPDWQYDAARIVESIAELSYVVLNPRREEFPMDDPGAAFQQIHWEYKMLRRAGVVLFWFPASESPQPIALYELGHMAASGKRIAVGTEEGYLRQADVEIQMSLARSDVHVHHDLRETVLDALPPSSAVAVRRMTRGERVEAMIAEWHSAPEGVADEPLHEYLGWTWEEYAAYTTHDALPPERPGAA